MARVTVEDCVLKVPNRFQLVMLAAQRARHISAGAPLILDRDNDKNPVVALREIAEDAIELPDIEEALVKSLQKYVEVEEQIEDMDQLSVEGIAHAEGDEVSENAAEGDDTLTVDDAGDAATMGANVVFEDAEIASED